jgi:hypothetical protein
MVDTSWEFEMMHLREAGDGLRSTIRHPRHPAAGHRKGPVNSKATGPENVLTWLIHKPAVLQRTDQLQLLPVRRFTRRAAGTNATVVGVVAALLAGNVTATPGQTTAVSIQASPTTG